VVGGRGKRGRLREDRRLQKLGGEQTEMDKGRRVDSGGREGGKEGRREGRKEGRREGGKRKGEKEKRREGGKEGRREGGKEGRREGGKEEEGGKDKGVVYVRSKSDHQSSPQFFLRDRLHPPPPVPLLCKIFEGYFSN
jgi:hypothetical protein